MGDLVPWGEWKPDLSAYKGVTAPVVSNVFPQGDGYGPAKAWGQLSGALPAVCRGFFTAYDDDGTVSIFAGTQTRLYKLNNSTLLWADISKTSAVAMSLGALTRFGDLNGGGGTAAVVDGVTSTALVSCAINSGQAHRYVGVTFATGTLIRSATIYGSNDQGFFQTVNDQCTITLYGKQGSTPNSDTDGTVLGTVTFTDTANESAGRSITSTDVSTLWNHVWVRINNDAANTNNIAVAELKLFGATDYSVPTNDQWTFTQFGTRVIACNANTTPQSFVMGSSSVFADLGGSPPAAQYCTTVNEFVILSGLTNDPFTIQWSSRSNPAEWTPGTNEGDNQTFQAGGLVRGVAGGEFGLVFQDKNIRRMIYAPGSAVVFEFDIVSEDMGLAYPYSIIKEQGMVFFCGTTGFQVFTPLGGFKAIGKERVDRYFVTELDEAAPRVIIGASDPRSSRVSWSYKSTSLGDTNTIDRIISYDWGLDRWSEIINQGGEYLAVSAVPSITLENLDTVSSSLDGLSVSLDSYSTAFTPALGMMNTSHVLGLFTGHNLEAIMETPDVETGQRVFVRAARPITDSPTVYGSVSVRQRMTDTATFGTETLMNAVGFTPHRVDTRIARFRNRIPSSTVWTFSSGVEPEITESGKR